MTPGPSIQDLIREVQQDTAEPDPLSRLQTAASMAQEITETADAALGYFVDQARRAGHSWSEIGEALGVTKQAAQQRHIRSGSSLATSFERFTPRARNVVSASELAARNLGHGFVGTEHILLALYSEPQALASQILDEGGLTAKQVGTAVQEQIGKGPGAPDGSLPYTPRAVQVFSTALGTAIELGHNYIGTEHILLGLLGGDGVAANILREAGFERDTVMDAVKAKLAAITGTTAEAAPAKSAGKRPAGKKRPVERT